MTLVEHLTGRGLVEQANDPNDSHINSWLQGYGIGHVDPVTGDHERLELVAKANTAYREKNDAQTRLTGLTPPADSSKDSFGAATGTTAADGTIRAAFIEASNNYDRALIDLAKRVVVGLRKEVDSHNEHFFDHSQRSKITKEEWGHLLRRCDFYLSDSAPDLSEKVWPKNTMANLKWVVDEGGANADEAKSVMAELSSVLADLTNQRADALKAQIEAKK
jgi:hypothetical protein